MALNDTYHRLVGRSDGLWFERRGSSPKVIGTAPGVATVILPATPSGDAVVDVTVTDDESDDVDLSVEVSRDNGVSWQAATVIDSADLAQLASSPGGVTHSFEWDTVADLGFRDNPSGLLRVTASDAGAGAGLANVAAVPPVDNLRAAANRVDYHVIHYGAVDAAAIQVLETYDLVVLHPVGAVLIRSTISQIQDGVDANNPGDDVIVLVYISVGEDLRTVGVTDGGMLLDARFVGDGTGPRIDPRGPNADGQSLVAIAPLGLPSNGGTGYASWYLDDNSVDVSPGDIGDGIPDRNSIFGGCFVNAGDPGLVPLAVETRSF